MSSLQEIEQAIDKLPKDEVYVLGEWLQKRLDEEWDTQFEKDVASGRLNEAGQEAITEYRSGNTKDFPSDAE